MTRGVINAGPTSGEWLETMDDDSLLDDFFEDMFLKYLDKAFTADVACCDSCYDSFIVRWPGVFLRQVDFESQAMDLDWFYEWSGLNELYTRDQFWRNVTTIECPRCGADLQRNIWPYLFPFDVNGDLEGRIEALEAVAHSTPFLTLSHDFGREVYTEIVRASHDIAPCPLPVMYRGRTAGDHESMDASGIGPPPAAVTAEGRYNHAGMPACYLASDEATVSVELGEPVTDLFMATVGLRRPVRILDLSGEALENDVLYAVVSSSLLSAPAGGEGWRRPEYSFSRFVADCARSAGLDGIRYPSTRASTGDNLVLFQPAEGWDTLLRFDGIRPPASRTFRGRPIYRFLRRLKAAAGFRDK